MTVTYSQDVSSASSLAILSSLCRWKGSIWKSIWPELCWWLVTYFVISLTYRFGLPPAQQRLHFGGFP
jgi:bestrophin-3